MDHHPIDTPEDTPDDAPKMVSGSAPTSAAFAPVNVRHRPSTAAYASWLLFKAAEHRAAESLDCEVETQDQTRTENLDAHSLPDMPVSMTFDSPLFHKTLVEATRLSTKPNGRFDIILPVGAPEAFNWMTAPKTAHADASSGQIQPGQTQLAQQASGQSLPGHGPSGETCAEKALAREFPSDKSVFIVVFQDLSCLIGHRLFNSAGDETWSIDPLPLKLTTILVVEKNPVMLSMVLAAAPGAPTNNATGSQAGGPADAAGADDTVAREAAETGAETAVGAAAGTAVGGAVGTVGLDGVESGPWIAAVIDGLGRLRGRNPAPHLVLAVAADVLDADRLDTNRLDNQDTGVARQGFRPSWVGVMDADGAANATALGLTEKKVGRSHRAPSDKPTDKALALATRRTLIDAAAIHLSSDTSWAGRAIQRISGATARSEDASGAHAGCEAPGDWPDFYPRERILFADALADTKPAADTADGAAGGAAGGAAAETGDPARPAGPGDARHNNTRPNGAGISARQAAEDLKAIGKLVEAAWRVTADNLSPLPQGSDQAAIEVQIWFGRDGRPAVQLNGMTGRLPQRAALRKNMLGLLKQVAAQQPPVAAMFLRNHQSKMLKSGGGGKIVDVFTPSYCCTTGCEIWSPGSQFLNQGIIKISATAPTGHQLMGAHALFRPNDLDEAPAGALPQQ